jgi:hypothetical protein
MAGAGARCPVPAQPARPSATLRFVAAQRFPIRVGAKSRLFLRVVFGVRPDEAWIELPDAPEGLVRVSFGWRWLQFATPLANVARWRIEGPWLWITAIAVRMSIRHHDVSFDGSPHGGVRLDFREPARWLLFRIPAIYVSADDLDGLAAAVSARGVPGEDARRRP